MLKKYIYLGICRNTINPIQIQKSHPRPQITLPKSKSLRQMKKTRKKQKRNQNLRNATTE